jgi:hypothetical protein
MKKRNIIIGGSLLVVIIICCVFYVLTGNKSAYQVKISQGNDTLVSGSGIDISKQDYFEALLDRYGGNEVLNNALFTIAEKELSKEEIDKRVDELVETYTKNVANGDLESYAKNLGYESKEEYIDEMIVTSAKQELLREKYLKENLDQCIKDYQVTSFKKIAVDKESTALEIIKEIKSVEDFDKKMEEYKSTSEDAGLVTKESSGLDQNLKTALEKISQTDKDGVYSEAVLLSDGTYAVLYVYNTDHKNTDDIISALSSISSLQEKVEGIYLKKYHFDVHDQKLKEIIQGISDQYLE